VGTLPIQAATVILAREGPDGRLEIFILKRSSTSSFMAGNYVYPGGQVEAGDGRPELPSLSAGLTPEEAGRILSLGPDDNPLAYYIAAVRELFEEAAILLAYDDRGRLYTRADDAADQRFRTYRDMLSSGKMGIGDVAEREKVKLALDQLHYYAHWITPEARKIRFDTRFFLALAPPGQEAEPDRKETTDGLWISPVQAFEENLKGAVPLSPPTYKTLEYLAHCASFDDVLLSLADKAIAPVLPIFTRIEKREAVVLPSDPDFSRLRDGGFEADMSFTRLAIFPILATRLVNLGDRWLPYMKE